MAALADAFTLDEALAAESLTPAVWDDAAAGHRRRLAEDPDALNAYQSQLEEAEDRLARPVVPLDDDLEAWVAFLCIYEMLAEPSEFLAENGLRNTDLSRLSRRWKQRFETDAKLVKRAEKLRQQSPPPELGEITVGTSKLDSKRASNERPLPVSPPDGGGVTGSSSNRPRARIRGSIRDLMPLDRYIALERELEEAPDEADSIYADFGDGDAELGRMHANAWRERIAGDKGVAADARVLAAHLARVQAPARVPSRPAQQSPLPSQSSQPHAQATPVTNALYPPPVRTVAISATSTLEGYEDVDETSRLFIGPAFGRALPFDPRKTPINPREIAPAPAPRTSGSDPLNQTADLPIAPRAAVTPFVEKKRDLMKAVFMVREEKLLDPMDGTQPISSEPNPNETLPFKQLATGSTRQVKLPPFRSAPTPPPAAKGQPRPGGNIDPMDQTAALSSAPKRVLPFEPSAAQTGAPFPTFTLEQYASLSAELSVHPTKSNAICARYHIPNKATQGRLHGHWRKRLRDEPELRQKYQALFHSFRNWLRQQR